MRRINVEGVTNVTRAVIGGMRERRYGRIVNVSSIAAIGTALPGNAFYAATKAEVAILTKRFAMELGSHNVTVNAVAPGFVRTDLTRGGRGAADWQGTEERFAAKAMLAHRRIRGYRECDRLFEFTGIRLDHGAVLDRGRWQNGLHRTRLA
jgi:3-oxoacyl-[acyl-carrier protein] reductase